jgi:hypothetical protein
MLILAYLRREVRGRPRHAQLADEREIRHRILLATAERRGERDGRYL